MQDFRLEDMYYVRATEKSETFEKSIHPGYQFRLTARDMARFGYLFIIDASCTENGSDGGDGSPEGTDSTSVTNRACIAAGKAAKSAAQYWTHRDLKASKFPSPLVRRSPGGSAELLCGSANDGLPVLGIDGPSAFTRSAACSAMSVTGAIDRADFSSSSSSTMRALA
jgi:hypothetical protein